MSGFQARKKARRERLTRWFNGVPTGMETAAWERPMRVVSKGLTS